MIWAMRGAISIWMSVYLAKWIWAIWLSFTWVYAHAIIMYSVWPSSQDLGLPPRNNWLKFTYWFLIAVFIWSRFRGFGSAFSSTSFVLSAFKTARTIFRNQKRFKQSSNAGIISQNIIIVFGTLNIQISSSRIRHSEVR